MTPRKSFYLALFCSFAVYFIPIASAHAALFPFAIIWVLFRGFENPAEAFTYLGAALGLQAAAFAAFYWFWRRPRVLPALTLAACGLYALVLAQPLFMSWVPRLYAFLWIERETPEIGTWTEACTVANASVMEQRIPRRVPEEARLEIWVDDSQSRPSVLRMPGCELIPAPLPEPHLEPGERVDFQIRVEQAVAGGPALVLRHEISTARTTYHLLDVQTGSFDLVPALPFNELVDPYLSDDGSQTGWIVPIHESGRQVREVLHLLPTRSGGTRQELGLSRFGPGPHQIVAVNSETGEILLAVTADPENPRKLTDELLATSLDGRERPAPALPRGIEPQSDTIVFSDHGVMAWDAYREELAWSMDTGSGSHRIRRGSMIIAAAVDPSGRYVAVSTAPARGSMGRVEFGVFVLRASDGSEVFKRYLKMGLTNVAFIGRDYFAYSDDHVTHVMQVR